MQPSLDSLWEGLTRIWKCCQDDVVKGLCSGIRTATAVWPWPNHSTSQCLSVFICSTGVIISTFDNGCENYIWKWECRGLVFGYICLHQKSSQILFFINCKDRSKFKCTKVYSTVEPFCLRQPISLKKYADVFERLCGSSSLTSRSCLRKTLVWWHWWTAVFLSPSYIF